MTGLARCIFVAGTASDVGKSVISTALCRVLAEEGYRVAPFKAQNMSNNAAVTARGEEIGRAQAVQAEAAGIEATADMNPLLLKPEADQRSQLVVLGRAGGRVTARQHWSGRSALWPVVTAALRRLRESSDVVVIEGAGSIAELNLRASDLANMRLARAADARVVLVGDIERGGIFAQMLGTLDLLGAGDRARVRALIVNKFRGDRTLFEGGVRLLRRRSGIPVAGVLPWRADLGVAAEDALAISSSPAPREAAGAEAPDIAVIHLPHIANFDDFEPLEAAGARLRWVTDPRALGKPDLAILPGTKTTIADLAWLERTGLGGALAALVAAGTPLLGICGGYQMLGATLNDPDGADGGAARAAGLGLLPVRTTFHRLKRTRRVRGTATGWILGRARLAFDGYEIHTGRTMRAGGRALTLLETGADGAIDARGVVAGTYVHGLFASRAVRTALLAALAKRRGSSFTAREAAADRYAPLGAWFRDGIDVAKLLHQLEIA